MCSVYVQAEPLHVANKFRRLGKDYLTSSAPLQISLAGATRELNKFGSRFG